MKLNSEPKISRKVFLQAASLGVGVMSLASCSVGNGTNALDSKNAALRANPILSKGNLLLSLDCGMAFSQFSAKNVSLALDEKVRVSWNEKGNFVRIQMSVKDSRSRYNPHLKETMGPFVFSRNKKVLNPCYQLVLISMEPICKRTFLFDRTSHKLLGAKHQYSSPPLDSLPVDYKTHAVLTSPVALPRKNGMLYIDWRLDFDALLDHKGDGGTECSFVPRYLNKSNGHDNFVVCNSRRIPKKDALSFGSFLSGNGFAIDATFENFPRGPFMGSRFGSPVFF
jgi:hypothetical protein